jgi:iron complex transport system ATP-binding protein
METVFSILTLSSLEIGFRSGKSAKKLLPAMSATAGKGELIAIIGRNGIGKSTLLRTMAGLQPYLGGSLCIEGNNIENFSRKSLAEKVGYISTETVKVSNLSVYDLASLGRFPHTNWYGLIDAGNHDSVVKALEKAGMKDYAARMISELSDGERQRAMIAMVLAQDAVLMLLDEPTAFLDIRSKVEIMHLLRSLTREKGKTIIFSTHDFDAAISTADKIWLLLDGGFIEGAPEDLILGGYVDRLFDDSVISFNVHKGDFVMRIDTRGSFTVNGEGDVRFWTEKAVIRSGYTVSESGITGRIITPGNGRHDWTLESAEGNNKFSSIYDLTLWLRKDPETIS